MPSDTYLYGGTSSWVAPDIWSPINNAALGEFVPPAAVRANIEGLNMSGLAHIYWGVKKSGD